MKVTIRGTLLRGMKIPLINKIGNFTKFTVTITSDVISVGFADIKSPKREPSIAINEILMKISIIGRVEVINMGKRIRKIVVIIEVTMTEYNVDAIRMQKSISFKESGALSSRSKDFSRVSIGSITRLTAVEVKNDVIAMIPIYI